MYAFPKPDYNYDTSLQMDFVPVHQFVKTERFEKFCDDKENILKLVNKNGDSQDPQHIYQQLDENDRDQQRFHDKSEATTNVGESAELFQSDSRQGNYSPHNQANKQQEQSFIVDLAAWSSDSE